MNTLIFKIYFTFMSEIIIYRPQDQLQTILIKCHFISGDKIIFKISNALKQRREVSAATLYVVKF